MRVLGISPLDKDSTVAVVEDGQIRYAAAEERFTRVKLQDGFPLQALQDAFERTGLGPQDFDVVAYPFLPWDEETRLMQVGLQNEKQFLDQGSSNSTLLMKQALARVPKRTGTIPGLKEPNERIEMGLAKNLAYRVLDLAPGQEVWAPGFTFVATMAPAVQMGAVPRFLDVDPRSWTLDPDLLRRELGAAARRGRLPRAVVAVDIYGQPADLDAILGACGRWGVPVVSDSAEGLGALLRGRPAGRGALLAAYSFNGN